MQFETLGMLTVHKKWEYFGFKLWFALCFIKMIDPQRGLLDWEAPGFTPNQIFLSDGGLKPRALRGGQTHTIPSSLSQVYGVYWPLHACLCPLHVVYNLTNNIDVENTKLRMEQYQRENRDIIQRNKAKLVCVHPHITSINQKNSVPN